MPDIVVSRPCFPIWSFEMEPAMCRVCVEHLAGSLLFPGFVPHRDPVWAAGDCASGTCVWPCVSHPPLSFQQTGRLYHAIVLSHLDDAFSPQNLTVTRLSDSCHRNQPSYPPGSKGLCTGDWQAFHFLSPAAVVRYHQFLQPAHVSICCDMQTIPSHGDISVLVAVPVWTAGEPRLCLQGLISLDENNIQQTNDCERKPDCDHP